jgi:hypothetical protein
MNTSTAAVYLPQTDRLGLLHRAASVVLLSVLTVCLSIFVVGPEPKTTFLIAALCVFAGGRRLFTRAIWPLLAIVGYDLAVSVVFPGGPTIGLVFQNPLFLVDCMLLARLALGGQSVRRQHTLMLGVLAFSLFGVVGDVTGHDMLALLPFPMPDDGMFDTVTGGDVARVRGFFAESGVLGAVSVGFATMLGIGAMVLIYLRARIRFSWFALAGAVLMGGAIFCLTITKSGLAMLAAGLVGFIAVLMFSRNPRCRAFAAAALAALVIGGAAFLVVGPPALAGYFRSEIIAAIHPDEMGAAMASSHSGMVTRYKCWQLAAVTLERHPFGVGRYGLGTVVEEEGEALLNNELRFFFSRDVFGLKNAFANLIASTGIVGLGLLFFWLWTAFIQPIRLFLAEGSTRGAAIAGVYGASALACLVFLFSCELYPSFAFLLVLKFHADAIAQACTAQPAGRIEANELIG